MLLLTYFKFYVEFSGFYVNQSLAGQTMQTTWFIIFKIKYD
jgi:hypothetical protein